MRERKRGTEGEKRGREIEEAGDKERKIRMEEGIVRRHRGEEKGGRK